jgi:hypothetical protein
VPDGLLSEDLLSEDLLSEDLLSVGLLSDFVSDFDDESDVLLLEDFSASRAFLRDSDG